MGSIFQRRDFLGGVLIAVLALGFLYFGQNLRLGTADRMGPGYLPNLLAWLLLLLGTVTAVRSLFATPEPITWPALRPLVVISAGPLVFGLLVTRAGLVLTIFLVAMLARLAQPERIGLGFLIAPMLTSAACTLVFSYLLEQPIPLWPGR